jgi:hypothetical protein
MRSEVYASSGEIGEKELRENDEGDCSDGATANGE